jgi:putative restriction endonuclease
MATRAGWTRQQLLVAFNLYCQIPFGKMHKTNPEVIVLARRIGRTPSALAMKLTNIASLDPAITLSGRTGLPGASVTDRAMWQEMQDNWEDFANEAQQALASLGVTAEAETTDGDLAVDELVDYKGISKKALVSIRHGQAFFRRSVLSAYDYRCCITGLALPRLLVASHIVPWKADADNRLNPRNGLCLSSLHDKAFDVGIITVTKGMTVRVSKKYAKGVGGFFGSALMAYDGKPIASPEKFAPREDFLEFHHEHVFESMVR